MKKVLKPWGQARNPEDRFSHETLLCYCKKMFALKSLGSYQMSRVVRKPVFSICENKDADQLRGNREADQRLVTAKLISAFVFATRIVQSLYFLNPKFQVSSDLL